MPSELGMALSYATMLRFPDEDELSVEGACCIAVAHAVMAIPVYFPACILEVADMIATTFLPWTQGALKALSTPWVSGWGTRKQGGGGALGERHGPCSWR